MLAENEISEILNSLLRQLEEAVDEQAFPGANQIESQIDGHELRTSFEHAETVALHSPL